MMFRLGWSGLVRAGLGISVVDPSAYHDLMNLHSFIHSFISFFFCFCIAVASLQMGISFQCFRSISISGHLYTEDWEHSFSKDCGMESPEWVEPLF